MKSAGVLALLMACMESPRTADPVAASVARGDYPRTTSVLLERGGTVLYEQYFDHTGPATLHDTRSVGKSITALAVGVAIAEGKLSSIGASAFEHLSDLGPFASGGAGKLGITLRDFLTMSSALACDDDDESSPGNELHMYPRREWARWAVDLPLSPGYQRDASGLGAFHYCTAGTFLLGQVLARATGEPVDRYIESRLLEPLGIRELEWARSPSGEVMTGGMLRLTTRGLAKLGRLVLQQGNWGGAQLVPAEWVRQATSFQRKPNRAQDPNGELEYGYLFWGRHYQTPCGRAAGWYMSGNGGNHVLALPSLDAVAVVTRVGYNIRGMHAETFRLLEQQLLPKLPCPKR